MPRDSMMALDIRVFTGGHEGLQIKNFMQAYQHLGKVTDECLVTYISIKHVKDAGWNPEQLVDWLLEGDVHFILSHVHQGLSKQGVSQMGWNMIDLAQQIARLDLHPGFPSGQNLRCPVFTQNKMEYLSAIPSFVNYSLQVPLIDVPGHTYNSPELAR